MFLLVSIHQLRVQAFRIQYAYLVSRSMFAGHALCFCLFAFQVDDKD